MYLHRSELDVLLKWLNKSMGTLLNIVYYHYLFIS